MNKDKKEWILWRMLRDQKSLGVANVLLMCCNNEESLDAMKTAKFPKDSWESLEMKIALESGDSYDSIQRQMKKIKL